MATDREVGKEMVTDLVPEAAAISVVVQTYRVVAVTESAVNNPRDPNCCLPNEST
jgi:hypothetical protein